MTVVNYAPSENNSKKHNSEHDRFYPLPLRFQKKSIYIYRQGAGDRHQKVDMVALAADAGVERIVIKPQQTNLGYPWTITVWTPVFTHFMHAYLAAIKETVEQQPDDP